MAHGVRHGVVQIGKGERAMELLPLATHSVNGPHLIEFSGAWMGEKELACEHMEKARGPFRFWIAYLRTIETPAPVGPAPRRSLLRKNRRLPRPEISLFVFNHAVALANGANGMSDMAGEAVR